jgi:ATP-dependent RNA helicase RhlE
VATDIAARGIDISSVSHVVQYELPDVPEQYVHRIGRTARAGKDGSAVAFCAEDERSLLRDIEASRHARKSLATDRRNDQPRWPAVGQNVNEDEKRGRGGARAESRGAAATAPSATAASRVVTTNSRDQRPAGEAGEQRQHQPRAEGYRRRGPFQRSSRSWRQAPAGFDGQRNGSES